MSKPVKIIWEASQKLRDQEFIETGKVTLKRRHIMIDPTTLTPAQREQVVQAAWDRYDCWEIDVSSRLETKTPTTKGYSETIKENWYNSKPITFDKEPSIEEACEVAIPNKKVIEWAEERAEEANSKRKKAEQEEIARQRALFEELWPQIQEALRSQDIEHVKATIRAWNSKGLPENYVHTDYATYYDRLERHLNDLLEEKAEAEKRAWIEQYGSEHLKRAYEAGYDCTKLYFKERASKEYPGGIINYNDDAGLEKMDSPSLAALDLQDKIKREHPGVNVYIASVGFYGEDRREVVVVKDENYPMLIIYEL